jgi:PAS domain S-box-containing protein
MNEPTPTYEELKRRLAGAEEALHALRHGRVDTGEHSSLARRLAETEARSEHIKQVLQAIRTVNQLIMFEDDPLRLIEQACVNLTEKMGYFNAWIALLDNETRAVTATAGSGFEHGFEALRERLEEGRYPDWVQRVLASDGINTVKEPEAECTECPLAREYGGRAGLSRRLHHGGRTYGVLSISVPVAYAFDDEEQAIFGELAINLAFALHKIEAERFRRAQEGIYTSLYENNHAVILLIDPEDGAIADANPAAERFYGWSRETLKGMNIFELNMLRPAHIRETMQAAIEGRRNHFFFAHRRSDGTMCDVEVYAGAIQIKGREMLYSFVHDSTKRIQAEEGLLEIESFDGKRKTILNFTAPVLDGDGQVDGAIIVNLDISERKVLEDQLLQAQKMESIGRLAGGVAHDFNNMLGVILGYSEMLLEQMGAGQSMYSALHGIQQAAQRSANLTRQLLAFARKQTVAPRVLDLNETVAGMLTMLRRLIFLTHPRHREVHPHEA